MLQIDRHPHLPIVMGAVRFGRSEPQTEWEMTHDGQNIEDLLERTHAHSYEIPTERDCDSLRLRHVRVFVSLLHCDVPSRFHLLCVHVCFRDLSLYF